MIAQSKIFLDHNAGIPIREAARKVWVDQLGHEAFLNPSPSYSVAKKLKFQIQQAQDLFLKSIGASSGTLIWTSGGTESNQSVLHQFKSQDSIFYSSVEHDSVLTPNQKNNTHKNKHQLNVSSNGQLEVECLAQKLRDQKNNSSLLSLILVNNETGVIQDQNVFQDLKKLKQEYPSLWIHLDAVQAWSKIDLDNWLKIADYMTFSGSKIGAGPGVGCIWVSDRAGALWKPFILGHQQKSFRGGTENVLGILAMGALAQDFISHIQNERIFKDLVQEFKNNFEKQFYSFLKLKGIQSELLGALSPRVFNTSQFVIYGLNSSAIITHLDVHGICASSGSACRSGIETRSNVATAMGIESSKKWGTLRISFPCFRDSFEVQKFLDIKDNLAQILADLVASCAF